MPQTTTQTFARAAAAATLLAAAVAGCVKNAPPGGSTADVAALPTPPPLSTEPIGVQIARARPRLADTPFRVLLDFERPSDLVFVHPAPPAVATDRAHTGAASLSVAPAAEVQMKLSSLVTGPFPGQWTLAGAYVHPAGHRGAKVTIAYRPRGGDAPLLERTVELTDATAWAPVFLDLTQLPVPAPGEAGLLTFRVEAAGPVFVDDVVAINNTRSFAAPPADAVNTPTADPAAPGVGWTVRQAGFTILLEKFNRFRVTLKTSEAAADGWSVEEAGDARARFVSATGKTWAIYPDGRQYRDGAFSPLSKALGDAANVYAAQHAAPADLSVPPEFGRIDRDTPGDQNNDGYNEHRGSYQLAAKSNRFEVTLAPRTPRLARPVLEIAGLPPGTPLVTADGQLIERPIRIADGRLLIELPMTLDRATTVSVTVK
jgi:hypothetical protein